MNVEHMDQMAYRLDTGESIAIRHPSIAAAFREIPETVIAKIEHPAGKAEPYWRSGERLNLVDVAYLFSSGVFLLTLSRQDPNRRGSDQGVKFASASMFRFDLVDCNQRLHEIFTRHGLLSMPYPEYFHPISLNRHD